MDSQPILLQSTFWPTALNSYVCPLSAIAVLAAYFQDLETLKVKASRLFYNQVFFQESCSSVLVRGPLRHWVNPFAKASAPSLRCLKRSLKAWLHARQWHSLLSHPAEIPPTPAYDFFFLAFHPLLLPTAEILLGSARGTLRPEASIFFTLLESNKKIASLPEHSHKQDIFPHPSPFTRLIFPSLALAHSGSQGPPGSCWSTLN